MHSIKFRSIVGVALAATALIFAPSSAQAQFKVIAHPEVGITDISSTSASNIFLKKDHKLASGIEASPVDLPVSSPVREAFSKTVLGRPATAVVTYWQQQVFSGKDTPPPSKSSDAAVVEFVKSTPGAIGYVSEGAATDGVKVLKVK